MGRIAVVECGAEPIECYFDTDRTVAVAGAIRGHFPGDKWVLSEGTKQLLGIGRVAPNVMECEQLPIARIVRVNCLQASR